MPGVADQERRTKLTQDHKRRELDMEELVVMVRENRLHEADERQLQTLKLVAELQKHFTTPAAEGSAPTYDPSLIEELKKAVAEAVGNISVSAGGTVVDPNRPEMKHVSVDLLQSSGDVDISHAGELGEKTESEEDAASKLRKLKELKSKN